MTDESPKVLTYEEFYEVTRVWAVRDTVSGTIYLAGYDKKKDAEYNMKVSALLDLAYNNYLADMKKEVYSNVKRN
jgi:hypothetical protein